MSTSVIEMTAMIIVILLKQKYVYTQLGNYDSIDLSV